MPSRKLVVEPCPEKCLSDIAFDIDGITVYMDRRHGLYLMGTTVDYQDGLNARGFTFDNPNATSTCGCGSSFSS